MKRNPTLEDLTSEIPIVRIEAEKDGTVYVWDNRLELSNIRFDYPDKNAKVKVIGNKPADILIGSGSNKRLFIACNVDCFDPPVWFIFADTWDEAYETACDEIPALRIDDVDAKDYNIDTDNPTCDFTSDGQPIDTETLEVWPVRLIRIEV